MTRPAPTADSPLAQSRLDIEIDGLVAEYTLRHGFQNHGDAAIEAVYSFPVPLDAAFLGMEASLAGETLTARVIPTPEARASFDDAISEGNSAVLLERLEPGLLCVDLGNLKPGEEGEILLRFACRLGVADGQARFSLPLVQRPRYGRSRLDELAQPEHDFGVEHPLSARIRVRGLLARGAVQCASHAVRFVPAGDAITLELDRAMLDRDLVLNFDLPPAALAQGHLVLDGDAALGIANFTLPSRADADAPLALCLVLDCSGSMSGDAIAQSRTALAAVTAGLRETDHVQVLRFGSRVVPIFRRPLRASPRVRAALDTLAAVVDADLGGTEMGSALEQAIRSLEGVADAASRVVVLVTDGAVQPQELAEATRLAADAGVRVFVVAVGGSAGADVLAPLAGRSGGVLERAVAAEPVDAAVMRHFRRARSGAPQALQVDWGGGAQSLPLPPAYPGDAVTAVARLDAATDRRVRLRAGETVLASASLGPAVENPALRAWAGQQVWQHAEPQERPALALHYGLLTDATAAVLVSVREAADQIEGLPVVTPVHTMLPAGMIFASSMSLPAPRSSFVAMDMDVDDFPHPGVQLLREARRKMLARAQDPRPPLAAERIAAIRLALREALARLLLVPDPAPFSFEELLRLVPTALHADLQRWLEGQHLDPLGSAGALALLQGLLRDEVGAPLSDDEEAFLAVATSAMAPA